MLEPGIEKHRSRFRVVKRVNGTLHRRTFDTLSEAREFLQGVEEQQRTAQELVRRPAIVRSVGDVVREWWEGPSDVPAERRRGHRDRVSPRTRGDYQYLIDRHVSRIADEPARAFADQPGLLKAFYDTFTARVSAWRVHAILRQAFEYAVEQRWIDLNPAALKRYHPQRVRRRRKTKLVPSREHVEKLLAAAYEEDELWGFFVYTLATLGLRCGEACALHWQNLDFVAHEVDIEWAVSTPKTGSRELGQMFLKEPKVGESRTLPVGAEFSNAHRSSAESSAWSSRILARRFRTCPRHQPTAFNRPVFGTLTKQLGVSAPCEDGSGFLLIHPTA